MIKQISDYGVMPSKEIIQTAKIQAAIDDCAQTGAKLVFEKGTYKTGTLFIKSNTNIELSEGAIISGSTNIEDYPDNDASFVDAVDQKRGKALILVYKAENVHISGKGTICGNGAMLNIETRPFLVRLVESKNLYLSDISLKDAAAWCLHISKSSYVEINELKINTRVNHNNDGIDIDSSDHITINECDIVSGDDGICLKSTSEKSCEYVSVKNCRISSNWAAFKIGTETVGDFNHIEISDCYMYDTLGGGIKFVPTDGANVKDVTIKNIKMDNCTGPIFIIVGERLRRYAGIGRDSLSTIEDVVIENIEATINRAPQRGYYDGEEWGNSIGGIIISGTRKNPIKNLTLKNISALLPGGITEQVSTDVSYIGEKYPEFHRMDPVPAKGVYIRDVVDCRLSDISLKFSENDTRELVFTDNTKNLICENITEEA